MARVIANHLASAVLLIPVGAYVQLSDGSVARIQKLNEAAKLSPVVESFGPNAELRAGQTIDLSQRPDLFIVRALDTSKLPPKMFDTLRDNGCEYGSTGAAEGFAYCRRAAGDRACGCGVGHCHARRGSGVRGRSVPTGS